MPSTGSSDPVSRAVRAPSPRSARSPSRRTEGNRGRSHSDGPWTVTRHRLDAEDGASSGRRELGGAVGERPGVGAAGDTRPDPADAGAPSWKDRRAPAGTV